MNEIFWLFILTLLPIFELRLTIPLGILSGSMHLPLFGNILGFGMPWQVVFAVCVIANALVTIPIFFFLDFFHHRFLHIGFYRRISDFFIARMQKKSRELKPQIDKYGYIALALFVGVPLPMTGAWSGALIAWLLGLDRKKSFVAITAGVLIAGIIVTLITLFGLGIFRFAFS
jgi:uncharacterized membrane protein